MKRLIFLLLTAVLLVLPLAPTVAAAQAVSDEARSEAAQQTAEEILAAAVAGDYNTFFDLLHPDVLAEVPRGVALESFAYIYGATKPGPATITDVKLGDYTWPVNGVTYPDTAEITYTQSFVNSKGKRQEGEFKMYLAPYQGQYRWFFGNSDAYIAEIVARFGKVNPSATDMNVDQLMQFVVNDLDEFFVRTFEGTSQKYVSPRVSVVSESRASTGCGPAAAGSFWGFYCPVDGTIYLDRPFMQNLMNDYGDFAVAYVIGHEWAHHVQTVIGLDRQRKPRSSTDVYSIELELMADCMAGIWSRDLDTRDALDSSDLMEASSFIFQRLGDPKGIDPFNEQAHGTGEERIGAFTDGYDGGFKGCTVEGLSPIRQNS